MPVFGYIAAAVIGGSTILVIKAMKRIVKRERKAEEAKEAQLRG